MISLICVTTINAQFGSNRPENYTGFGFQVDPLGSIDKGGPNIVAHFTSVDFGHVEYELQSQVVLNNEEWTNYTVSYIDVTLGVGYRAWIGDNIDLTGGGHFGMIMRPKSLYVPQYTDGYSGAFTFGFKGSFKYWINDFFALTLTSTVDSAPDVPEKSVRLNTRGGFLFNLGKH